MAPFRYSLGWLSTSTMLTRNSTPRFFDLIEYARKFLDEQNCTARWTYRCSSTSPVNGINGISTTLSCLQYTRTFPSVSTADPDPDVPDTMQPDSNDRHISLLSSSSEEEESGCSTKDAKNSAASQKLFRQIFTRTLNACGPESVTFCNRRMCLDLVLWNDSCNGSLIGLQYTFYCNCEFSKRNNYSNSS